MKKIIEMLNKAKSSKNVNEAFKLGDDVQVIPKDQLKKISGGGMHRPVAGGGTYM